MTRSTAHHLHSERVWALALAYWRLHKQNRPDRSRGETQRVFSVRSATPHESPVYPESDLARNLAEQLQCQAALAQGQEQGLLRWRDDLVWDECEMRAEGIE